MKVLDFTSELSVKDKMAVSVGVFDGCHVGHQNLLNHLVEKAKEKNLKSCVITFRKHPDYFLRPDKAPKMLSTLDQRLGWFKELGVENVIVVDFDKHFSQLTAEQFIANLLIEKLKTKLVVVGHNFKFGKNRAGDINLLKQYQDKYGYTLDVFGPFKHNSEVVSSTLIRSLVKKGEIEIANELLNRRYEIVGKVVKGDKRGSELGFPTANVDTEKYLLWPQNGIYAGTVKIKNLGTYKAAISIGKRPTFYEQGVPSLEAYLLDFSYDIYGYEVTVGFVKRLRDERKFSDVKDLIVQMVKDVEETRNLDYKIEL